MRLHVLFGLGCVLGGLVSCATGGKFQGTGGSSTDGGGGGDAGSGGETTMTTGATGGTGGGMTTTSTTSMETCDEAPCKLVAPQCGCTNGDMCALNGDGDRECHAPGDKLADQECTGLFSCAPGLLCTLVSSSTSVCTEYCETDAQCDGGLCLLQLTDPSNPNATLPGVTLCSDDCDPVTNSGCPGGLGLGCQLGQQADGAMTVFTVCGGAGSGAQGATCVDNEDCAVGSGCFTVSGAKQCLKYCKPASGVCGGGTTCVSFDPQLFYKGVEYGVCL